MKLYFTSKTPTPAPRTRANLADWFRLTKPGIVVSNSMMVAVGAILGGASSACTVASVLGTAALVAGCGVINMVNERAFDRRMPRTTSRPVADRRIRPGSATTFGGLLLGVGAVILTQTTATSLCLGLLGAFIYLAIYTPLKAESWWAVPVGAVAGAIPPIVGWTSSGDPGAVGLLLFGILYIWQLPHFIAIGIRRFADYQTAGLRIGVPPAARPRAIRAARALSCALLATSLLFGGVLSASATFFVLVTLGGSVMILATLGAPSEAGVWARRVFLSSLVYLPLLTLASIFA